MLRRESKEVELFKNRKYQDYIKGFHDDDYENYWIGLENGHQLTSFDFRLVHKTSYDWCISLATLNSTTQKLIMFHQTSSTSYWDNCIQLSHRGGKLIIYKRSLCICADPETKLITTCSCNDKWLPKVTIPKWTKDSNAVFELRVNGHSHRDIQYVGYSTGMATGLELKAASEPWSNGLFKYQLDSWDVAFWTNETDTSLTYRQHYAMFSNLDSSTNFYQIASYGRDGSKASPSHPFNIAFRSSNKPRGTDIDGGFWTYVPVPSGGGYSLSYSCLLCSHP